MRNKLEKLEAVRGLAAIYVDFNHSFFSESFIVFGKNLSVLFRFGQEAVILFFLMSGFVIGYSFENGKNKSFESYFKKRFIRIYIPLFLVLITHYILIYCQKKQLMDFNAYQLLCNLFMLQDLGALKPNVVCEPLFGNSPLWSLSYEWWFYMLFFPIYTMQANFKKLNFYVGLTVIVAAISYLFYPFFINRLLIYFSIWWAGVVMALSYSKNGNRVKFQDLQITLASLLSVAIVLALNAWLHRSEITSIGVSPLLELRHVMFTIVVISIAMAWQSYNWKFFDSLFLKFSLLAPISYVLYISHYFLIAKADYLSFTNNKYILFLVYLIIGVSYSYFVEIILFPKLRGILNSTKISSSKIKIKI